MVFVNQANVAVIQDTWVISAINCHAIHVVPNMDSAKMERASVRKAGMDVIAHYVSVKDKERNKCCILLNVCI